MSGKKIAVITGASQGIGRVIAKKLVREGFFVILVGRQEKLLKRSLKSLGKQAIYFVADVSSENQVRLLMSKTMKKFGRINVLINGAASMQMKKVVDLTLADFEETVGSIFRGTFLCIREFLNLTKKQNGILQIININSLAATRSVARCRSGLYSGAKAAISKLSEIVQQEMLSEKRKVKICNIFLGIVLTKKSLERGTRDPKLIRKAALKPEDVAHTVWSVIEQGKNSNINEIYLSSFLGVPTLTKNKRVK